MTGMVTIRGVSLFGVTKLLKALMLVIQRSVPLVMNTLSSQARPVNGRNGPQQTVSTIAYIERLCLLCIYEVFPDHPDHVLVIAKLSQYVLSIVGHHGLPALQLQEEESQGDHA